MKKAKLNHFLNPKPRIKNSFLLFFILGLMLTALPRLYAAPIDSATGKKIQDYVSSEEDHSTASRPYKDPAYYKNIPVQKAPPHLSQTSDSLFKSLSSKYHGEEFDYQDNRVDHLSWFSRVKRKISQWIDSFLPNWNFDLRKTFYYILVGLGVFALVFLIYKLTLSGKQLVRKDEEEEGSHSPEWVEKRLESLNLNTFLEKALSESNFPLAIRYLHLINLKKLAAAGQIKWDYQKTNQDFLYELKDQSLNKDFAGTIRIYEYVWYGHFQISGQDFNKYQTYFNQFNREIR